MRSLIILLFSLPVILSQQHFDESAWRHAAKYLKEAMDDEYRPCENFYDHVCGNYSAAINDTSRGWHSVDRRTELHRHLYWALTRVDLNDSRTPPYQKAVRIYFDQCTSVGVNSDWSRQLYEAVRKRIGHLPVFARIKGESNATSPPIDPWLLLGRIQREFGENVLLLFALDTVEEGCTTRAEVQLMPAMVTDDELASAMNLTDVHARISRLGQRIGLNETDLDSSVLEWLGEVEKFYAEWANITRLPGTAERYSLGQLDSAMPDFDWREYLRGLLPTDVREQFQANSSNYVFLGNKEQIEALGRLFKRYDHETIQSFAYLKVLYSIQQAYFGPSESGDMWRDMESRCLHNAKTYLPAALARLYFDSINVDILKWRHEVIQLGRNIFSAFRYLLNNVDWLDGEDKEKIQEKIDDITFNPGIPTWIGDDAKVMERIIVYDTSLDPFENEFSAWEARNDRYARILLASNRTEKDALIDPSFEFNAQYDPSTNQVEMFLGFMLPPLFNISYPLPVKYGGLGAILGHELMHAFDSFSIYFGVNNEDDGQPWLKPSAFEEFEKRKSCLVRQYSRYCYRERGRCVSGERTIGENIADIDGLKVAYTAYKILGQVFGSDPPIEEMIQYTSDQLFFLSYARNYCATTQHLDFYLDDVHTPHRPRVESALRNTAVFSKAFQCPVGSTYAPVTRCGVWGELEDPM